MMSVYRRSLLLLALTACSHSKAGTVVFGAAGPWNEAYGDANKKGIELAVDEINASPAWSKDRHLEIVFAERLRQRRPRERGRAAVRRQHARSSPSSAT